MLTSGGGMGGGCCSIGVAWGAPAVAGDGWAERGRLQQQKLPGTGGWILWNSVRYSQVQPQYLFDLGRGGVYRAALLFLSQIS